MAFEFNYFLDACAISPVINENTTSSSREMLDSIALSCSTSTNSLLPPISPFNALQSSSERHVSIVEFAALKGELRKLKNEKYFFNKHFFFIIKLLLAKTKAI